MLSQTSAALLRDSQTALSNLPFPENLQHICERLQSEVPHYTWVGFYFMNHEARSLHLGPYAGLPTDHTVIPFGKGICGQVAVSGDTYIADDVTAESNYIACSVDVKSEIVVPIYDTHGALIAQLDIDSNVAHAFDESDEQFLKELCGHLGEAMTDRYGFAQLS